MSFKEDNKALSLWQGEKERQNSGKNKKKLMSLSVTPTETLGASEKREAASGVQV